MSKKAQTTVVLREKELFLVSRAGTASWQIHYKVQSLNKWLRKSTGTHLSKDVNLYMMKA